MLPWLCMNCTLENVCRLNNNLNIHIELSNSMDGIILVCNV